MYNLIQDPKINQTSDLYSITAQNYFKIFVLSGYIGVKMFVIYFVFVKYNLTIALHLTMVIRKSQGMI